jgi:ATP-dependent protease Clp ATPase subunit
MFKHKEPRTLIESVKKSVIGQDTAITDLGNFIFNYILFQYSQYSNIKLVDRPITLLVGASGSGKTFMVKTIAEEMKFNFLEINVAREEF